MASEKENEEVPISALEELLQLQADGDTLVIKAADGTTKQMRASILCWELVELLCGNNYQARNAIYRGKDLTDVYTNDELASKVSSGDWSNLFIGDYITREMTTTIGGTENVDMLFAHFNYFLECGSTALNSNHILMVPRDDFQTLAQMNDSNTTEGGYVGSAMYTDVIPAYDTGMQNALGGHVLQHYRYLTNTVNTSAPSAGGANLNGSATAADWYQVYGCLMSEAMLYGGSVFSSSGRDISDACMQLAIFALAPNFRVAHQGKGSTTRYASWLCGVASSTYFCYCSADGDATYYSASGLLGVRPYYLFG